MSLEPVDGGRVTQAPREDAREGITNIQEAPVPESLERSRVYTSHGAARFFMALFSLGITELVRYLGTRSEQAPQARIDASDDPLPAAAPATRYTNAQIGQNIYAARNPLPANLVNATEEVLGILREEFGDFVPSAAVFLSGRRETDSFADRFISGIRGRINDLEDPVTPDQLKNIILELARPEARREIVINQVIEQCVANGIGDFPKIIFGQVIYELTQKPHSMAFLQATSRDDLTALSNTVFTTTRARLTQINTMRNHANACVDGLQTAMARSFALDKEVIKNLYHSQAMYKKIPTGAALTIAGSDVVDRVNSAVTETVRKEQANKCALGAALSRFEISESLKLQFARMALKTNNIPANFFAIGMQTALDYNREDRNIQTLQSALATGDTSTMKASIQALVVDLEAKLTSSIEAELERMRLASDDKEMPNPPDPDTKGLMYELAYLSWSSLLPIAHITQNNAALTQIHSEFMDERDAVGNSYGDLRMTMDEARGRGDEISADMTSDFLSLSSENRVLNLAVNFAQILSATQDAS